MSFCTANLFEKWNFKVNLRVYQAKHLNKYLSLGVLRQIIKSKYISLDFWGKIISVEGKIMIKRNDWKNVQYYI